MSAASVHPTAVVDGATLDPEAQVFAYATIAPGARVGRGAVVQDHAVIRGEIEVGATARVGPGARLCGRVVVGDGAIVGANAVVGEPERQGEVVEIAPGAVIEANAVVRAGVVVGRGAVVQPGSVVSANVPAHAVVSGIPARIVGYTDDDGRSPAASETLTEAATAGGVRQTRVRGVTLHPLTRARDLRGSLAAIDVADLPFVPARLFSVFGVPSESIRGAHAHRECAQLLVCAGGELSCLVDDGQSRQALRLTGPHVAIYVPPLVWAMQYEYSLSATLVVLASHVYDPADYVRDYEEFLHLVRPPSSREAR